MESEKYCTDNLFALYFFSVYDIICTYDVFSNVIYCCILPRLDMIKRRAVSIIDRNSISVGGKYHRNI